MPPELAEWIARLGLTVVTQPSFVRERGDSYLRDVDAADRAWLYRCRGALDARATSIHADMMRAAVHALAALARQDVPDEVARAYGVDTLRFGREYIIPKPFDPRVLLWVAPAVAQAAVAAGVARRTLDPEEYRHRLEHLLVACTCLLAHDREESPRTILEQVFRRSVSDREWRTRYLPLLG